MQRLLERMQRMLRPRPRGVGGYAHPSQPKIIITGGLGFIFSHVTEYFVRKGWNVVVIDNLSVGSHPEIIDGSFKHYNVHMAHPEFIDVIVAENPDYVIHAAAISDVDYSVREPNRTLHKNILGNLHAFEACRSVSNLKKFIYISTDEVYGECPKRAKESDIMLPRNPYSCGKATGSLMRVSYDNTYPALKGKTAETRFCNVFGPRQDTRKIMPIIKRALEAGDPVPVFDEGGSYREYIHVENIPPVIDLILQKGTGVYNVTQNDGYTVRELIQKVEEVTGKKIPTTLSHRPGIDMKYQMDNARICELGWKPAVSFEEGLKKYLGA
jgi:nucleoside-diphosphate-sugar epimerase